MNERQLVPLVGGPRDGDAVRFVGPEYREIVPTRVRAGYIAADAIPTASPEFPMRVYVLKQWWNGAGFVPRYVLRERAKGLGAA